jgi:hypothetical protein
MTIKRGDFPMVDADFQLSSDSDFPRSMRRADAARYSRHVLEGLF